MAAKSAEFCEHTLEAERSAAAATDPTVKGQFLEIARSWRTLAETVERGTGTQVLITTRRHDRL
jgi:hypothetical protein